ncbi:MAG: glycosyltransferase family 4 protein [Bacteroidetes bacterium]|nr:glycosyltransferase family 4 protein [Bacteroidota bacterium]
MHIVYLSGEYALWATGGVGVFLQTIGRGLVKDGHMVTVLGVGNSNEEIEIDDEGVRIIRLPKNTSKLPNFWINSKRLNARLKSIHQGTPIDIIESAEGGLAFISKRHPAKKIIRLHGGHHFFAEAEKRGINKRKGIIEYRSFKKADAFIAISQYVKSHTQKYLSYHGKPISVIASAIDTNVPIPDVVAQNDRVLFAGTICEKKGVRQLLQAFKLVRDKYPNKELELYGRLNWVYPDGVLYLDRLKEELAIEYFEQVHFRGSVPRNELDAKYAAASFCIFPSHMETQGLVSIEAMLLEKAVVFSKYGPGPETIEHGKTGLLCDVYSPNDIAEKMIWCIENPEEARQLGVAARKKVKETYNLKRILNKNIAFYNTLLNERI